METPIPDFNIDLAKHYIETAPSEENGWKLEFEGFVNEDVKDSTFSFFFP